LKIDIEVDKVNKIKGPFSQYALEYLGLNDAIEKDLITYKLKKVIISTVSEPDPQQVYFVARTDKQSREEEALLLSMSSSGVFMGAELLRPLDEKQIGLVSTDHNIDTDSLERYFRFLAVNNRGIKIDTITRKITIDTTTIYRNTYKSRAVEKTDEQKARDAVEQIEIIRTNRFNIITGYQEVPYSKDAMAFMVDQLNKMEEEYLDLFRGKILKQKVKYSYIYIPEVADAGEEWIPVFGLSERTGFQALKDANDELFYLGLKGTGATLHTGSELPGPGKTVQGLTFRVPEPVNVKFKYKGKTHNVMMTEIGQFGTVSVLPQGTTKVNLHPSTGAIKSVLIEY